MPYFYTKKECKDFLCRSFGIWNRNFKQAVRFKGLCCSSCSKTNNGNISSSTDPDEIPSNVYISFASKFWHYACFYIFEGTEYQDNYSIYDSILKTVLPVYLDYYQIDQNYSLDDYKQYRKAVDKIRELCGIEISRNGFDHLLWYYHKGRI